MKAAWFFALGAAAGAMVMAVPRAAAYWQVLAQGSKNDAPATAPRAHTIENFAFTARGTMDEVAPLFGADKERVWAPDWSPQFLYPQPAIDQPGMVFTVDHHGRQAVWVNTAFDVSQGRMQYVYVVPEVMATVITLRLTPQGNETKVAVTYERTALSPQADRPVRQAAEVDRAAGPDWQKQVNDYLAKAKK